MIDIDSFLKQHQKEIVNIISNLENDFSSHDFIKKFAQQYETDYIEMLVNYQGTGKAFQYVHKEIAKHLSLNKSTLRIDKTIKKPSENVFGNEVTIQWWKNFNR